MSYYNIAGDMSIRMGTNRNQTSLCRECFYQFDHTTDKNCDRCPACASPRVTTHPELKTLTIAHLDCDAFYAAVEKRDNPALAKRPLIIGGGKRGVVATACYLARVYGVRSAMPMFKAQAACPHAVIIKPNMEKYKAVAAEIRQLMSHLTPLVQPISIDEAFLDLSGTERVHRMSPSESIARLAKRIENETGVTASVGLSYNKFLAKIASDLDKPRGFAIIGKANALHFLAPKPVTLLWGVGRSLAAKLRRDGIAQIGQLQKLSEQKLVSRYGSIGTRLYQFSRGMDDRLVTPDRETKSISAETTFINNTNAFEVLEDRVNHLCEKVLTKLVEKGFAAGSVTLKLKRADFSLLTRTRRLQRPTRLLGSLQKTAIDILKREADGTYFRLVGVGAANLTKETKMDPPDLFNNLDTATARIDTAMHAVRTKFGSTTIRKGND